MTVCSVASDKTVTLTVNQQTARTIALPDGQTLYLSGMGYNGKGEVQLCRREDAERLFENMVSGS